MPMQKHIDYFRNELDIVKADYDKAIENGDVQKAAQYALMLEHIAAALYALGLF